MNPEEYVGEAYQRALHESYEIEGNYLPPPFGNEQEETFEALVIDEQHIALEGLRLYTRPTEYIFHSASEARAIQDRFLPPFRYGIEEIMRNADPQARTFSPETMGMLARMLEALNDPNGHTEIDEPRRQRGRHHGASHTLAQPIDIEPAYHPPGTPQRMQRLIAEYARTRTELAASQPSSPEDATPATETPAGPRPTAEETIARLDAEIDSYYAEARAERATVARETDLSNEYLINRTLEAGVPDSPRVNATPWKGKQKRRDS